MTPAGTSSLSTSANLTDDPASLDPAPAWRVVGSPRRREILRLVWREEQSAGAIRAAFPDVTFGAISQHLRGLRSAGLVERRKEGRRCFYRARREALGEVGVALEAMWGTAVYRLKILAELADARRGPRPAVPADGNRSTSDDDPNRGETK